MVWANWTSLPQLAARVQTSPLSIMRVSSLRAAEVVLDRCHALSEALLVIWRSASANCRSQWRWSRGDIFHAVCIHSTPYLSDYRRTRSARENICDGKQLRPGTTAATVNKNKHRLSLAPEAPQPIKQLACERLRKLELGSAVAGTLPSQRRVRRLPWKQDQWCAARRWRERTDPYGVPRQQPIRGLVELTLLWPPVTHHQTKGSFFFH